MTYSRRLSLLILSFLIIAFGQPTWIKGFGCLASCLGYALFWIALAAFEKGRFSLSLLWFTGIQLIQLSWMTSWEYVGPYILFAYLFFCIAVGLQFALLTWFIPSRGALPVTRLLGMAGLWTVFEWVRIFFICGYTWNPVGLALSCEDLGRQWAQIAGVYGMSFWVMAVNLMLYKVWLERRIAHAYSWAGMALLPFFFGAFMISWHDSHKEASSSNYRVVLVQTALLPEEKFPYGGDKLGRHWTPLQQWQRVMHLLKKQLDRPIDLIVLPEAVVPYGSVKPIADHGDVLTSFQKILGGNPEQYLPKLEPPLAKWVTYEGDEPFWGVGNAYFAQALANFFNCEVVAGLEDFELEGGFKSYQAAFHFTPFGTVRSRYEKQILVPMAEYIPFEWCKPIAAKWGIIYFFTPGTSPKIFPGKLKLGPTICYEETFAHLVRQTRQLGANLLVNVTNDVWYPGSRLPLQHFELGKLRTVENGMPSVRACNTGITAAIDSCGRSIEMLGVDEDDWEWRADSLYAVVPTYHYQTLYSFWGDYFILIISFAFALFLIPKRLALKTI